jgi:uncharacterized membrane protein YfcA
LTVLVFAPLGALAPLSAPRALLAQGVADRPHRGRAPYFAVAPNLSEAQRHPRLRPRLFASTLASTVGFYDGVFGPGAGSF